MHLLGLELDAQVREAAVELSAETAGSGSDDRCTKLAEAFVAGEGKRGTDDEGCIGEPESHQLAVLTPFTIEPGAGSAGATLVTAKLSKSISW